jgi:hypothetical protein
MAIRATEEWRSNISAAQRERYELLRSAPRAIRNLAAGLSEIERDMKATGEVDPAAISQLRAYAQGAMGAPVRLMPPGEDEEVSTDAR